jgi:5'(3')-deoxyribonucleotidase
MLIAVDLDNVLNDLVEKTLVLYNSRTGKNIQINDVTTYKFYECLPREDADGIIALFKERELWDSLEPLPGSQKVLRQLANQGHRIIIATATDPCNFEWKCQWVAEHYPFIQTDNIIRIMDKSLLSADVLIDDHIENLTSFYYERVCIDYLYNRSNSKDYAYNIHRVKSWDEIPSVIRNIERKMKQWEKM